MRAACLLLACLVAGPALGADFTRDIRPLLADYCLDCHEGAKPKGDLDLARFTSADAVAREPETWVKVEHQLDLGEMPPEKKPHPSPAERERLLAWVRAQLDAVARATAGDPGPVVLRRLTNAEYTHTLRDLTGVSSLDPARDLPVDGAAGEGFANVGDALVMDPALLEKYLDAAKRVAAHLVPLPDGIAFSERTSRRDWTDERLAAIRALYALHTSAAGATEVNLQGVRFKTNDGGRLPLRAYLAATQADRAALDAGSLTPEACAAARKLNPKYLGALWRALRTPEPSALIKALQARWAAAGPGEVDALARWIEAWQDALWKFNPVGQIGKAGAAPAWMTPMEPLADRQEFRVKMPAAGTNDTVALRLIARPVGGSDGPVTVVWERPRLVAPGRADLLLRDVPAVARDLAERRRRLAASASACLAAAEEVAAGATDLDALAQKHGVARGRLDGWLDLLGLRAGVKIESYITGQNQKVSEQDPVRGWVGADALSVVANHADQEQRIPGLMKPRSVAVHPSPALAVAVGWRSPADARVRAQAFVQDAHTACGNGVVWALEVRRGATRQRLAGGATEGDREIKFATEGEVAVRAGDLVSLIIGPRDGSHVCDLTAINLTLVAGERRWDLAEDIVPDILAGNPHADRQGHPDIWHFYSEPASGVAGVALPAGSLLTEWQAALDSGERKRLAAAIQDLLKKEPASLAMGSPDAALHRLLTAAGGPLIARPAAPANAGNSAEASISGKGPDGEILDSASLAAKAPQEIVLRVPADLAEGCELVVTARPDSERSREAVVQARVCVNDEAVADAPWPDAPLLAVPGSLARQRMADALGAFRDLFPAALCYAKIVPVDEVITLIQFHREDDALCRLMLDDAEKGELDRLWDELRFVSQDALTQVAAFDQLWQFATQDADPKVLEPLRQPVRERAAAFRLALTNAEPGQVDAVIAFADRAWRRPLVPAQQAGLRKTYDALRAAELPHDEALRLLLARVLTAPAFLYKQETPGETTGPVDAWALAVRLSYFLTSSAPDEGLRASAASGRLLHDEELLAQARRLREGPHARRWAEEFGLYWLHLADFDRLDEKSPRHFPEFAALRGPMREEAVLFLADLLRRNAPLTDLLAADHTFVNADLAKFYGLPPVDGADWRRVDGVRARGRGGILALGATLARQSGASRTSPILRGTWISEVLLGEKLPKPPPGVPVLPEDESALEGLTVRQLVEKHSSDPACVRCHRMVDPFGYSLERYDAIGRLRERDLAGRALDTAVALPGGVAFDGLDGLRGYLQDRRRDEVCLAFCRKLLGYALGRSARLSDRPLLEAIRRDLAPAGWPLGEVIDRIVLSPQFRGLRGRE